MTRPASLDGFGQLVLRERRRVADQLATVEEAGGGGIDDAVAAAGEDHHVILGAYDRQRIQHRHQLDRGDGLADARVGERLLVHHGEVRPVDGQRPVRHGRAQPLAGTAERVVHHLRPGSAEAVEGGIAREPERCRYRAGGPRAPRRQSPPRRTGNGHPGRTGGPWPPGSRAAGGPGSRADARSGPAGEDRRCSPSGTRRTRRPGAAAPGSRPARRRGRRPPRSRPPAGPRRARGRDRPAGLRSGPAG